MTSNERSYEDRQVQRVVNTDKRTPLQLAEAYGKDAVVLVNSVSQHPSFEGLVRLYTRIATHFALDVLQRRGESRMGD